MDSLRRQLYLTYRVMRDRLDEGMRAAGASMTQWIVLKTVDDSPDLSQRQLAERVLVTGSTLTHHLDRMEADGLIVRRRDAHDRRIIRVGLTAAGKHRQAELDAFVATTDEHVAGLLSARDAATLNRLLHQLQQQLTDSEGERR